MLMFLYAIKNPLQVINNLIRSYQKAKFEEIDTLASHGKNCRILHNANKANVYNSLSVVCLELQTHKHKPNI
jgi:hypothetical protein